MTGFAVHATPDAMKDQSCRDEDPLGAVFVPAFPVRKILSSAKIVERGASLEEIPLPWDARALWVPVGRIVGDVLAERDGDGRARRATWQGFACPTWAGAVFPRAKVLPGASTGEKAAGQRAYDSATRPHPLRQALS